MAIKPFGNSMPFRSGDQSSVTPSGTYDDRGTVGFWCTMNRDPGFCRLKISIACGSLAAPDTDSLTRFRLVLPPDVNTVQAGDDNHQKLADLADRCEHDFVTFRM